MQTFKKHFLITLAVLIMLPLSFQSCDEEGKFSWDRVVEVLLSYLDQTGWLADDESDEVPNDVEPWDGDNGKLPTTKSLENWFPPIGDQGKYGTCVVWSTGYNLKTALNAKQNNWSTKQLASESNQTSPKDLWLAMTSKSSNCNGANFEPAFDALMNKGAKSMQAVPYASLGTCSGTTTGDAANKIVRYRMIAFKNSATQQEGMNVNNFKRYLNDGQPIAFGAQLGERFMLCNSDAVLSDDGDRVQGQHAYHALALVGYDDNKNAFRVRNSWGESWGDKGSIWIDYDFFIKKFCFAAYVAENTGTAAAAPRTKSVNNLSVSASDFNLQDNTVKVQANNAQRIIFVYYNAFNARDCGVLAETNQNNAVLSYMLPSLTGKYYFAAIANPDGDSDFYFFSAADAQPLEFVNGILQNAPVQGIKSITSIIPNAYTPEEIKKALERR